MDSRYNSAWIDGVTQHTTHTRGGEEEEAAEETPQPNLPLPLFVREGEFAQPTDETMQILAENPLRGASKTHKEEERRMRKNL